MQPKNPQSATKPLLFRVLDFTLSRPILKMSFNDLFTNMGYFLLGAISGLGFAPTHFSWLTAITFIFLIYKILVSENKKNITSKVLWFGLGHFFLSLSWIMSVFFINPATTEKLGIYAPFAVMLLSLYNSLYFILPTLTCQYFKGFKKALVFALSFSIGEWLRGLIFTGFPWNSLHLILTNQIESLQIASVFGPYFVTFILVFSFALIAYALTLKAPLRVRIIPIATSFLILITNFTFGYLRLKNNPTTYENNFNVRLVQIDIPQGKKWDKAGFDNQLKKYKELSKAKTTVLPDLIIWPETAIISPINLSDALRKMIVEFLQPQQFLITGFPSVFGDHNLFNSLGLFNHKAYKSYHKHHLVPFGEYVPFNLFKKFTAGQGEFSAGPGPQTLTIEEPRKFPSAKALLAKSKLNSRGEVFSFSPLICYEAIFTANVINLKERPDFMVNITNDAWYGRSAGPYQHFDASLIRTIEEGLPMLRVANGGLSGIIDAYGRVVKKSVFEASFIESALPSRAPKTLYALTGNWLSIGIMFLFIIYFGLASKNKYGMM
jgi:apolipoprotein N-acyltransferase